MNNTAPGRTNIRYNTTVNIVKNREVNAVYGGNVIDSAIVYNVTSARTAYIDVLNHAEIQNINITVATNINILNKPGVVDMHIALRCNIQRTYMPFVDYITSSTRVHPLDCAASVVPQHAVKQIYRADSTVIYDVAVFSVQYVDHAVVREMPVSYGYFVDEYIVPEIAVLGQQMFWYFYTRRTIDAPCANAVCIFNPA